MSDIIVSISGLRGIIGSSLTPDIVARYTAAFASFSEGDAIVVGRDGRPSGEAISRVVAGTLNLCGYTVIDLGVAPTPTVQLAVSAYGAAGGIAVTASHNPEEWNGLKFLNKEGIFLDHEESRAFLARLETEHVFAGWDAVGSLKRDAAFLSRHIEAVLTLPGINLDVIRGRRFSVVVDAVNASGSIIVPDLLRELGCRVIPLACDGSGRFPHPPEPLPVNLRSLGKAVLAHGADLGVAIDPDADRLVLYAENGEPFGEEYTITAAVDGYLSLEMHPPGAPVVVNLSTTRAVEEVAARYAVTVERTPVGEINVVKRMLETGAMIGGEGSGGVIVPVVHPGRDALVGLVLVLHALAAFKGAASEYRASLPAYTIVKQKFDLDGMDPGDVIERAATGFANEKVDTRDGARIDFERGWVHLRKSNTEPILRVIAEADTAENAKALARRVMETCMPSIVKPA